MECAGAPPGHSSTGSPAGPHGRRRRCTARGGARRRPGRLLCSSGRLFFLNQLMAMINNLSDSRQSPTNESTDQPKRFRVKLDPIILMVFYAIREFIGGGCALDFCLSSKRYVSAVNTELKSYVQLLADDVSCKKLIMFFSKEEEEHPIS
ncbi:uncharacterized protein LOC102713697 isoform X2 [Oryza brachyantha]|uniref:uncharacterized protein LOC102713697 isoform X2 n=1 Tax=Oryza brachyantha TaxID=4533 RepID=UPI0007761748|nr:uncharacterized protein LOC102713697 isoform X2 [Oryza brachyantha]